jgi:uncharacterized protein (TIGR02246 family)
LRACDEAQRVRLLGNDVAVVISGAGILMAGEHRCSDQRLRLVTWVLTTREGRWLVAADHNRAAN